VDGLGVKFFAPDLSARAPEAINNNENLSTAYHRFIDSVTESLDWHLMLDAIESHIINTSISNTGIQNGGKSRYGPDIFTTTPSNNICSNPTQASASDNREAYRDSKGTTENIPLNKADSSPGFACPFWKQYRHRYKDSWACSRCYKGIDRLKYFKGS
jgi:hypothetical protein